MKPGQIKLVKNVKRVLKSRFHLKFVVLVLTQLSPFPLATSSHFSVPTGHSPKSLALSRLRNQIKKSVDSVPLSTLHSPEVLSPVSILHSLSWFCLLLRSRAFLVRRRFACFFCLQSGMCFFCLVWYVNNLLS